MKKAINTLWNITSDHGFVILLSVAAIVHSAWSINSVFNGAEPTPMYSEHWWGWYIPGLLMAITIDVGLVQFVFKLQAGERSAALIIAYLVLCGLMAFGQFIYVASHMADIQPSAGVAIYDLQLTNMLIKLALYVYPLALPVVSAIYAFSVRGQREKVDGLPALGSVNIVEPINVTDTALPAPEKPALPAPEPVKIAPDETQAEIVLPASRPATEQALRIKLLRTSDRHCKHCGKPLPPTASKMRLYCSDSCRQLAHVGRKVGV